MPPVTEDEVQRIMMRVYRGATVDTTSGT